MGLNNSGYGGTSSSSGALLQLLAVGQLDKLLTVGASRTFFKSNYSRCTPFSLESITQSFGGTPSWGGESSIVINRSGDLLWKQFIKLTLPGLRTQKRDDAPNGMTTQPAFPSADCDAKKCSDLSVYLSYVGEGYTQASDNTKEQMLEDGHKQWEQVKYGCAPAPKSQAGYYVSGGGSTLYDIQQEDCAWWTECIGYAAIKRCEVKIGGSVIDVCWSELLYILEELEGQAGKRYTDLVGRTFRNVDKLIEMSRETQIYYVPLPFWYCSSGPSMAFPLCATQFHNMSLNVQFAPLSSLIHKSHCDLLVLRSDTGLPLGDSDLTAAVTSTYIHLSTEERDNVIANPGTFLITQHQAKKVSVQSANLDVSLGFSFAVSALMFVIRRKSSRDSNDHFNFAGVGGRAPLNMAALAFNSTTRVSAHPEVWWRLVQPQLHWPSLPLGRIYSYSFALQPAVRTEPSGTANASRLDSMSLELQLQDEFSSGAESDAELFIFARSFNQLVIKSGMVAQSFSS